ncbi:hypothetical protein JTB14_026864 [Gonioctena quinquepunctata]|nr:hypothetical protein JTB14_026864 [Gonioctena quinquepunctata]
METKPRSIACSSKVDAFQEAVDEILHVQHTRNDIEKYEYADEWLLAFECDFEEPSEEIPTPDLQFQPNASRTELYRILSFKEDPEKSAQELKTSNNINK